MKKMRIFCAVVFVFMATGLAYGHSEWGKYKNNPVPDDVNVPKSAINEDGTLNCCFCHGAHPGIPEGPGGCKNQ